MSINVTAAEKEILSKVTIPPRPEALLAISAEAKKPEPDVSVIAQSISADISISSSVLQVVNSAAFSRGREVASIQQAVMTLGLKRLIPLVKSVALKSAMGKSDQLAQFWQQASLLASACSLAVKALKKDNLIDHAYMLGLFHNAGIPIMLLEFDTYAELIAQADEMGWQKITEIEREKYGTSHTTISTLLGQKWTLPAVMTEVIYYQHDVQGLFSSDEISKTGLDLLSILKIARFAVFQKNTGNSSSIEWQEVNDDILEHLGLEEAEIDDVIEDILEGLGQG